MEYYGHSRGFFGEGRQTTVGLSKSVIFIVCYWLYTRKLLTGYTGYI